MGIPKAYQLDWAALWVSIVSLCIRPLDLCGFGRTLQSSDCLGVVELHINILRGCAE